MRKDCTMIEQVKVRSFQDLQGLFCRLVGAEQYDEFILFNIGRAMLFVSVTES